MSSEKLAPALRTETTVCQPNTNTTVSSTVTTKRNQQVYTQQIVTSRRVRQVNSSIDNNNTIENQSLIPMNDSNKSHVDVKRTTKTFCRRIIRKTGPNGEVSEEIIEEGDPISSDFFPTNTPALENIPNNAITNSSSDDLLKPMIPSTNKFQATAEFNTISESGEKRSLQLSTGPMELSFNNQSNNMLMSQDNNEENNQLAIINNPSNAVQQVLPDGTIVTRTFYGAKTATVTHSSTINGQTQTSSKSAFMSFSGESMMEAKSSINNMEAIFGEMMKEMQGNSLNIFNHFITSGNNTMVDHLALAGGDMECSLLALEAPSYGTDEHVNESGFHHLKNKFVKAINTPETIHESGTPASVSKPVSKDQQEEAFIQKQIKAIKDSKASNRLYWSSMEEVKKAGILADMKKEEIHLQEAIFEVITSEASYNISLDTLIEHYYNSELLNPNKTDSIINAVQKHHLFSNILLIKTVSLKLLKDFENRWSQQKPRLTDLADIILKHAQDKDFQTHYINYLTNQSYQINCLRSLLQKDNFKQALISIQSNPQCCKLSLDSFLALPMQRLTRLKLLVEVILKLMHQSEELYKKLPKSVVANSQDALSKLKELLTTSENNKYKMEQKARLIDLTKILDFSGLNKAIAIGSMELIKEGEVKASPTQISSNALKKLSKKKLPSFYLIVLNDLVIIAKKKSATKMLVLEYCEKDKVEASVTQNSVNLTPVPKLSRASIGSQTSITSQMSVTSTDYNTSQTAVSHPFILKFNKENDTILTEPLVLTAPTIDIRDQWINAITSK